MQIHEDQPDSAGSLDAYRASRSVTLEELFERYHQEIYRLCVGMLNDAHEAEDAAQDVFLRAQRAWSSYDPLRAAPRTWLGQIAMNRCRSLLRRRRLWAAIERLIAPFGAPSAQPVTPADLRADIGEALYLLDERHRSVVILRYYLELSCAEIATVLQINEGTVRSRLSNARRRMRAALEETS
jgi:RNA polymerase sigma-70 factor (ECF subfamily)